MQNEKKYFLSQDSMLDADSADFVVPQNAWVNMENARTGTTDAGVIGTVESIGGTELITENDDYIAIGTADDVENKRFVTLYYDNSGNGNHKIQCCYTDTNTIYTVLNSSDVTNGLNFTLEPIHSARIIDNILSWVNGTNNEPRKINIESGMVAYDPTFQTDANPYSFPLNFSEITLIKRPPAFTPNISKQYNATFQNNFIANESFEFAFQYTYYDNETSVVGAYSQGSRLNFAGDNFNYINILMDFGEQIPSTVKIINLIVRISDGKQTGGNIAFIAKTWDKNIPLEAIEISNHNNAGTALTFNFYNNITGEFLAEDDTLRPFDNIPVYSHSHEVAKNRYFLGNNIEGYNAPKETSLTLSLNIIQPSSPIYNLFVGSIYHEREAASGSNYILDYYQSYYILGNILINGVSVYGYYQIISTIEQGSITGYNLTVPTIAPPPTTITISDLHFAGATTSEVRDYNLTFMQFPYDNIFSITPLTQYTDSFGNPVNYNSTILLTGNDAQALNIFPQISNYNAGIVFYDYAMRKCSVVPYNKSDYQLFYTYQTNIQGTAPNQILFSNSISSVFLINDKIEISGGTAIDGTYTINTINSSTSITVNETISTTNLQSGVIRIYRLIEQGISTPLRDFNFSSGINGISWNLNNNNTINEIPNWAYYYSAVRTLNLTKRFFVQGYSTDLKYVEKDSNGNSTVFGTIYNTIKTVGLAINSTSLNNSGLGYIYTEGDQAILTFNNNVYQLPIIGQEGNYVIVKPINIGTLTVANSTLIFEFYTPYKKSEQEPYYEIGEIYKINNPKTLSREYSILSGVFYPDTYLLSRNSPILYVANTMSPNDRFYQRWDSDAGKVNFVTKLGQTENTTEILWSDTLVSGTQINGTSTFRAGNNTYVPSDCGAISKLILTSKVQDQGTVMLSICTNETNSMYLGETQITDSTGKVQFFGANASQVISTINTLKGSFGTVNPEAVVEFRGSVFYPDANRGVWVQYSSNGLFPISNYKMTRFWKLFFKRYLSSEGQQYMADNNIRPYLFSTVDASHLELLISIPKIYENPPKGYLVDYPNDIYPFDIYDGKGKTVVFCLENTGVQPHWQGSYSFNPEQFMCLQNKLYSMKDGNLFQHNMVDNQNNFYGRQYTSKIMVVSNQLPQRPKVYNNISVEGNMKPIFVYLYNDYPYLQTSDLEDVDFRDLEGVFYATLYRNKIIDNGSGTYQTTALLTGEKMRNVAMKIMFEFDVTEAPLELKFVNIGYAISKGHTT
jgi:hypothetical protein